MHSPIEASDGLRILAARGRGRGLPANRFDVWMANLGPSEQLRDAILAGKISWGEFRRRYFKELMETGGVDARNERIKNHGQKFTLRLLQHLAKTQPITDSPGVGKKRFGGNKEARSSAASNRRSVGGFA